MSYSAICIGGLQSIAIRCRLHSRSFSRKKKEIIATDVFSLIWMFLRGRYAYSGDPSEEFDKDDTLTLIKPSPMPSKDVRSPTEVMPVYGGNGVSNGDMEEDKTE